MNELARRDQIVASEREYIDSPDILVIIKTEDAIHSFEGRARRAVFKESLPNDWMWCTAMDIRPELRRSMEIEYNEDTIIHRVVERTDNHE